MFKEILSDEWPLLNPVLQQHYGIKEGESIRMHGELAVRHGKFIKLLMPFIRLTGALVPVAGDNFIVTVENKRIGDTLYWHREFKKENKVYSFNSKMQQFGNNIVEFVGLGIGIRMGLKVQDGGLVYEDKGYVFKLGSRLIPIPLNLLMGKSEIEEFKRNDKPGEFDMRFTVNHPWFGFAFSYMGHLTLEK